MTRERAYRLSIVRMQVAERSTMPQSRQSRRTALVEFRRLVPNWHNGNGATSHPKGGERRDIA